MLFPEKVLSFTRYADVTAASVCPDWLAFELTQPVVDKLSSTTDKMLPSQASITRPELTLRFAISLPAYRLVS